MLEVGWSEILVVLVLTVLVLGPDEIPRVMRTLGRIIRRFNYFKYAISRQFDDLMQEADLDDIRKQVNFEARQSPKNFNESGADEDYLDNLPIPQEKEDGAHE